MHAVCGIIAKIFAPLSPAANYAIIIREAS